MLLVIFLSWTIIFDTAVRLLPRGQLDPILSVGSAIFHIWGSLLDQLYLHSETIEKGCFHKSPGEKGFWGGNFTFLAVLKVSRKWKCMPNSSGWDQRNRLKTSCGNWALWCNIVKSPLPGFLVTYLNLTELLSLDEKKSRRPSLQILECRCAKCVYSISFFYLFNLVLAPISRIVVMHTSALLDSAQWRDTETTQTKLQGLKHTIPNSQLDVDIH